MPRLSVVTPVYNGESFVGRCYSNLLDQTYSDWEWVVVDDGSTDGTANEVKNISDPRVRLITYPDNKGRGYARTRALEACRGEWIVIWDVDDLHFPERLEQVSAAAVSGYDFFCSYAVVCNNQLEIKGVRGFYSRSHGLPKIFVHPTMAVRLDIAKNIGYDESVRTGEDAEILWILPHSYNGLWCHTALSIYQEDREVNLQKAIDSNLGHLSTLMKLYKKRSINLKFSDFLFLSARYYLKILFLRLLSVKPDLYLKSVAGRSYGEVDPQYCLSDAQISYINSYARRST